MIAITCAWGADLAVGPTGDINALPISADIQARIIRRLLTNPGDYIWHTDYGAGLGRYVGEPYSPAIIEGAILIQLKLETLVATAPAPTIQIKQSGSGPTPGLAVTVQYQVAGTALAASAAFALGS